VDLVPVLTYNNAQEVKAMDLAFAAETIPLRLDEDGIVRVGGTRVRLETLITSFSEGATAEEIVQRYPTLHLADVYQVIGYFLRRPSDVDAYLLARRDHAEAVRKENEARFDPEGVRDRLLARRTSNEI
jgi:uncharacterized protein (DUF433 family)